jgi:hypothetical protein
LGGIHVSGQGGGGTLRSLQKNARATFNIYDALGLPGKWGHVNFTIFVVHSGGLNICMKGGLPSSSVGTSPRLGSAPTEAACMGCESQGDAFDIW